LRALAIVPIAAIIGENARVIEAEGAGNLPEMEHKAFLPDFC
jgi:hypothetical protein